MTIGIAASGPAAARAILEALAAAETIGVGAIGGFISFACIGRDGFWRCGRQSGGARGLLEEQLLEWVLDAPLAVLMSSGPQRPEPLSQFTPGSEAVGLVTGHRFPNQPADDENSLGEAALDLMRQGLAPQEAALSVAQANPTADAGLICLGLDGRIGLANTQYVDSFPGLGRAEISSSSASVAILCNAIRPANSLAALIADLVMTTMQPRTKYGEIVLSSGLPVKWGGTTEIAVDAAMNPTEISLIARKDRLGVWHGGYGPFAPLAQDGRVIGHLIEEPFLTGRGDWVESFDGKLVLPVRYSPVGRFRPIRTKSKD